MSLRFNLTSENSSVQVYEILPPKVKTNLDPNSNIGEDLNEFVQHAFTGLVNGQQEIGMKMSDTARKATRSEIDETFQKMGAVYKQMLSQ
ncbi:unnamed protein product [Didymodactylos carnosus]|uniref:Uncharacterized protein n=1 Tax=Didymodactylos carnosus TaxID=1234261 RepID=A0A8S2DTQ4_9BILA|nr:unnamed protein product [Didymodactylos carnosus]CAF3821020.1 unnamed protein product [Didymodactylos carnosus]